MERPTEEQVAAARERLRRWYGLDFAVTGEDFDTPTIASATITVLAHLDAVTTELAEARTAIRAIHERVGLAAGDGGMMVTKAMTRFLCEKVLGWEPLEDEGMWRNANPIFRGVVEEPDFTTWTGFGLLLMALAKDGKVHSDPRTALALAAARAYGWKEE